MVRIIVVTAAFTLIACTDSPPPTMMYKTPLDEQREITLSDGSTALLNAGSQVEVTYSEKVRLIRVVSGEVYFEVMGDDTRSFQVQGGNVARIMVKENDTSAFETRVKKGLVVSVERGNVSVGTGQQQKNLTERQQIVIAANGNQQLSNVKTLDEVDSTWREGWIQIEDAPLDEVIEQLNGYYNNQLRLRTDQEAELSALRVSARLYIPDIKKVIRALARSMKLKTSTQKGFIIFYRPEENKNQESAQQ